jgi:hypothetical protein
MYIQTKLIPKIIDQITGFNVSKQAVRNVIYKHVIVVSYAPMFLKYCRHCTIKLTTGRPDDSTTLSKDPPLEETLSPNGFAAKQTSCRQLGVSDPANELTNDPANELKNVPENEPLRDSPEIDPGNVRENVCRRAGFVSPFVVKTDESLCAVTVKWTP